MCASCTSHYARALMPQQHSSPHQDASQCNAAAQAHTCAHHMMPHAEPAGWRQLPRPAAACLAPPCRPPSSEDGGSDVLEEQQPMGGDWAMPLYEGYRAQQHLTSGYILITHAPHPPCSPRPAGPSLTVFLSVFPILPPILLRRRLRLLLGCPPLLIIIRHYEDPHRHLRGGQSRGDGGEEGGSLYRGGSQPLGSQGAQACGGEGGSSGKEGGSPAEPGPGASPG